MIRRSVPGRTLGCKVALFVCGFVWWLAAGCSAGSAPPPAGRDAGTVRDAGTRNDAGTLEDASAFDAGTADAGVRCPCPTLPVTCTAPAPDTPVFTPDDPRYGDALFGLIACADTRIRAAVYEATWDCFAEALQARLDADSDLVVELVVDDDRCPSVGDSRGCALGPLAAHPRVTFVDDMRSRLMHHKFITVDDRWAWVSSGNMTTRSFCTDFNNAIVVEEPAIVAGYDAHFERMFELGAFGPAAPAEPSRSGKYALYFSPETPIDDPSLWFVEMIEAIESATSQVTFVISAWTRVEVSTALVDAHNRGLSVRGVVSGAYVDEAPAQALLAAGVPLRVDNVHSKVLVVDDRLVVTGSPNWSLASWQNNENSLFIDDPAIAAAYGAEIDRIFASAAAP